MTAARRSRMLDGMDLIEWLATGPVGIAHRDVASRAGYSRQAIRAAVHAGALRVVRRVWIALPVATGDLVTAAENGARVACVSAARHRGWWLPEDVDDALHLHVDPHARRPTAESVVHWTVPVAPTPPTTLVESIENTLAHVAGCLSPEHARVVWESALCSEPTLSLDGLQRVVWPGPAARAVADAVSDQSDSGLESIFLHRVEGFGVRIRQQVRFRGRPVDFLLGDRLVVQIDGFAHHSTSAQRTSDVAFDAELVSRGYNVLRFTYAQIVHGWDDVERILLRALAMGDHRAA